MKEMFLTKEGTFTEMVSHVFVSEDNQYYNSEKYLVTLYEKLKIKDFDKLIPETYFFNNQQFIYPSINSIDLIVTYSLKDDNDIYVEFKIDSNFNENTINDIKPSFYRWDKSLEQFVDIFESDLENYL